MFSSARCHHHNSTAVVNWCVVKVVKRPLAIGNMVQTKRLFLETSTGIFLVESRPQPEKFRDRPGPKSGKCPAIRWFIDPDPSKPETRSFGEQWHWLEVGRVAKRSNILKLFCWAERISNENSFSSSCEIGKSGQFRVAQLVKGHRFPVAA